MGVIVRNKMKSAQGLIALFMAACASVAVVGCGTLIDMGRTGDVNPRRVYLNDPAANDSLPATLATEGLLLVMQPGGKQYTLRTPGGSASDPLDLYVRNASGGFTFQQSITGTAAGTGAKYNLTGVTSKSTADYYLVFLRGNGGMPVTLPDSVKFTPVDTTQATSVSVRLHMVRRLQGLSDSVVKATYARTFHDTLKAIFSSYGITVDTSTAIVEPDASPLTVVFNGDAITLPGTRLAGAINIYLVNSIEGGSEGSTVVGFAPREAFDLSTNEESRIVLNMQGGSAASMAVTAAHEMGHFMGLRHTSATEIDRGFDKDDSNRDDGFSSTPYCSELTKRAVAGSDVAADREISVKGRDGRAWCLRVTGTALTCACADVNNLMYPYKCPTTQKTTGADQQRFMRNNLRVFQ